MTDDTTDAATAQSVYDAWDGSLRLDLSATTDEDGEAFPGVRMQQWRAVLRVPTDGYTSEGVTIGQVTAFVLRAPDSFDTVMSNYDVWELNGDYKSALSIHHPAGGSFWELFTGSVELLNKQDLLTIDRVVIDEPYRDLHDLVPVVLSAISNGPIGRTAAMVVCDSSTWNVPFTDDQQEELSFAQWADTTVLATMNADPDEAYELAMNGGAGAPPVGARNMDVNLGAALEDVWSRGPIAVPFTLPPRLPANVWAGAPEDIHEVRADAQTGSITIETHTVEYEVVGAPGTAPQLVGVAADAEPQVRDWLRAVHERWWQYEPDLHSRIHDVIGGYMNTGWIDATDDETVPHLHAPDVPNPESPWPGAGDVHLQPVSDEPTEPAVFHAILEHGATHEHVGAVILHDSGYLRAFLHDEWTPGHPDPDAAVQHLASLGAKQYFGNAIHEELSAGVEHNLLTGDVRGH
ncbi:hypothetical protein [Curtobacterium sp. MCSS17_016]|uniref:hypothetical protein n=1 Tax=Curtobacterium sp. MCSS17_016 TaxID=2175644 RepID=UPI0011B57FF2|nr:hypothetical protein [Curtobacterium sp. MCSS17_016]WIE81472.1 hypothetical protein DEJ19_019745 [Curtobacterium sp. MCSS17_016]